MDFHSLTRKELQSFCKKNRIPANMTNVAMADALSALQLVEGLEDFTRSDTDTAAESPEKMRSRSVTKAPSTVRSSKRLVKANLESAQPASRTRGGRRRGGEEVSETPAPSTRRKTSMASVPRKTGSPAREEVSVQRTYATRRSARLAEKMSHLSLNGEDRRSGPLFTEKSSTDQLGLESKTKSDESFDVFDGSEVLSDPRFYVQPQNEGDSKDVQRESGSGGRGHSNSHDAELSYESESHSDKKEDELLQNEGESKYEIPEDVSEGASHDLDNVSVSDGLNENKEGPTDILAKFHISHAGDLNADQNIGPKDSFGTVLSGNAIAIETDSFVLGDSDSKGLVEPFLATEEENIASESINDCKQSVMLVEKMAGISLNGEDVRSSDLFTEKSSTDQENVSESIAYCKTSDEKSSENQQDYCANQEADFDDSKIFPQLYNAELATEDESGSLFAVKEKIAPGRIADCKTSGEKSSEDKPNYCSNNGADFEDSKTFPQLGVQLATEEESDGTETDESSDEKSSENQQNYIVNPPADVEGSKVFPDLEAQLANGEVSDGTDAGENSDKENIAPEGIADRKTSGEKSSENQSSYCVNPEADVEDLKVFPDPAQLAAATDECAVGVSNDSEHSVISNSDTLAALEFSNQINNVQLESDIVAEHNTSQKELSPVLEVSVGSEVLIFPYPAQLSHGDGTDADENSSESEENAEAATDECAFGVSSDSEHSVISISDTLAAFEFSNRDSNKLNNAQLESDIVAEHNTNQKELRSPVLEVSSGGEVLIESGVPRNQPLLSLNVTDGMDSKNPSFESPKRICSSEITTETPRSQYKAKTLSVSGTVHLTPKCQMTSIQVLDDSQSLTKKTAASTVQRMNHLLDESCCKENIVSSGGTHAFDVKKESIGKNMRKHINQDKKALNDMSLRQLRAIFKEQKLTESREPNDKPEVNGSKMLHARPALQALPENHAACDNHLLDLEDN